MSFLWESDSVINTQSFVKYSSPRSSLKLFKPLFRRLHLFFITIYLIDFFILFQVSDLYHLPYVFLTFPICHFDSIISILSHIFTSVSRRYWKIFTLKKPISAILHIYAKRFFHAAVCPSVTAFSPPYSRHMWNIFFPFYFRTSRVLAWVYYIYRRKREGNKMEVL